LARVEKAAATAKTAVRKEGIVLSIGGMVGKKDDRPIKWAKELINS
jgi:hypothetical protein